MFDLSINNVYLVDYINKINKKCSIGIEGGKISEISEDNLQNKSKKSINLDGKLAVPGIIDIHTHITPIFGGSEGGLYMLAKAGVCTAVDLAGPIDTVYNIVGKNGSGINVAVLESIRPGENIVDNSPNKNQLKDFINDCLVKGAIGCKLLGGHYPLTLESSGDFVEVANKEQAYVCWHAGTTNNINTIKSFEDLIELTGNNKLHAAHINTYCRGIMEDEIIESHKALDLLDKHKNIYSEAYLAQTNGINFRLDDSGHLKSKATGQTLRNAGYEDSEKGIINALRDGFAHVFAPCGIETNVYYGEEAIQLLIENKCEISGGFDVNPPLSRLCVCLSKNKQGRFIVDAISTDGGAIPRNVTVSYGMALVKMGMLTVEDFVYKTSVMPAKMLGLKNKGHLSLGSDADITIIDKDCCNPIMTIVNGNICMYNGIVLEKGGTIITTERGHEYVLKHNLPTYLVESNDFLPQR